jgi:hypothetical protein
MFNQVFIPFLTKENLLTATQAHELIEQQKHARIRLGVLAVEEKLMSRDDVNHVNRLQASQNARFGDIAVARNYLTQAQVESLLNKQPREHIVLKQLITDKGYLTGDRFDLALGTFKTALGVSYEVFEKLQDKDVSTFIHVFAGLKEENVVLWEYVKMFINTTIRFIDREVRLGKAYTTNGAKFKHVVWQRSAGDNDKEYTYVVATNSTRAACAFSASYGKMPIDAMDEDFSTAQAAFSLPSWKTAK